MRFGWSRPRLQTPVRPLDRQRQTGAGRIEMSQDLPMWAWVLIAASSVLTIAWIIYSIIIIYRFSIRGNQVGGGSWFIVGVLILFLLSAALAPANTFSERVPFIALIGLFAAGIIVGVVRNTKKPAPLPNRQPSQPVGPANVSVGRAQHDKRGRPQYEAKYCFECGALIRAKAEICPNCGVRQPVIAMDNGRTKLAAALFALFLGGLGIHKFYLGQIGWGIVYLLWVFRESSG